MPLVAVVTFITPKRGDSKVKLRKDVLGDQDPQAIVVGVTGDVRHTSLASPPFREAYLPIDQSPLFTCDLVVRTIVDPKSITGDLKKAIWSLDRDESVGSLRTLGEVLDLD